MEYIAYITECSYGFVKVKADSEEEAIKKGKSAVSDGNVHWGESEITKVKIERNTYNEI